MSENTSTKSTFEHTQKQLPKSEVELTITVPAEKLQEYYKKASEEISGDLKVKGFRPGKVPAHILEQYVDKMYILAHARELAVKYSYSSVVIQNKIQVVGRPEVKIEGDDHNHKHDENCNHDEEFEKFTKEPLVYTAKVAIMPEVKVKDHKSIKIPSIEVKVEDSDLESVINDMKRHGTTHAFVDRGAQKGDRVEIDFQGYDEKGETVPNTDSKHHPVIIGENTLIPGFEENLIGVKKDEEKEFDLTFPKDYFKEDFQNKKMKFKVKVHHVEEPQVPELNEELIEKMTGKKDSVEDFKKELSKNILARKEQEAKGKRENDYIEELVKRMTVEIPESMIADEVEHIIHEVKDEVTGKGMEFEAFLERSKTTIDDLRKKYQEEGEKRLKIRMALQYVIKEEGVEISPEDIKTELERVKSFYPAKEHYKIDKDFKKGPMKDQIASRLTLRKLFKKVLE